MALARRRGRLSDALELTVRHHKMRAFLEEYSRHANISLACQAVQIHRATYYFWMERSSEEPVPEEFCLEGVPFCELATDAGEQAADILEEEVRRRAVDGIEEPVFGNLGRGEGVGQVGTVRKFSDILLMFLLKKQRPVYRENHKVEVEHTGRVEIDSARDRLAAKLEAALAARENPGLPPMTPADVIELEPIVENIQQISAKDE